MCFGIPMEIKSIDNMTARCEAKGVLRDISLFMLQHEDLAPGDFVVTHLGTAIEKIDRTEALAAWEVYDEMLQLTSRT
jgi:hydrogenase expression/formation protein HypC